MSEKKPIDVDKAEHRPATHSPFRTDGQAAAHGVKIERRGRHKHNPEIIHVDDSVHIV
jgi:hypothetical protein